MQAKKRHRGIALLIAALLAAPGCRYRGEPPPVNPLELRFMDDPAGHNSIVSIPRDDLPGKKLVIAWDELVRLKLIESDLKLPEETRPWSTGFFPAWYGGVAGRWQDSHPRLFLRSLTGSATLEAHEAYELLRKSAAGDPAAARQLFNLSPTEKYDLAVGDYVMSSTIVESLMRGHNMRRMWLEVPFWTGYCNGLATAASYYREPDHEVDVVNPDGFVVRFHPNDVKALLGIEHSLAVRPHWQIGARCDSYTTDSLECNDVNAGTFVIALANRIGLARKSFVIDINPLAPVVNAAIRSARISIEDGPRPPPPGSPPEVKEVVDVRLDVEIASTLLSDRVGDVPAGREGVYQHATGGSKLLRYDARLALGQGRVIIGGNWSGWKMSGPDFGWGMGDDPTLEVATEDHLNANRYLHASLIEKLAAAAAGGSGPGRPRIDLPDELGRGVFELYAEHVPEDLVRVTKKGKLVRLFCKAAAGLEHMNCTAGRARTEKPGDVFVTNYAFPKRPGRFAYFDVDVDVTDKEANFLRCDYYGPAASGSPSRVGQLVTEIHEP